MRQRPILKWDADASRAPGLLDGVSLPARRTISLSGLASDPLRPEGRTIPPLPAVPSVRIVRRDDRAMRKGWVAVWGQWRGRG